MKKVLLITMILCSTGVADDKPAREKTVAPLDVIADCVDAVKQRDFRRYVDHLSPDEQKLQAGVVLLIQSSGMMSVAIGAGNDTRPSDRLLMYVLNDLRKKHTVPKSEIEDKHTVPGQANAALLGQVVNGAVQQIGAEYLQLGVQFPTSGRHQCIQSAAVLKDPAAFLAEALEEVLRPTEVSGKQPKEPVDTLSMTDVIEDLCEPYEKLEFTLYTRGDYAIAIADLPPPVTAPAPAELRTPRSAGATNGQYAPAPAQFASPSTDGRQSAAPAAVLPSPARPVPYGPPQPYAGPSIAAPAALSCETGVCRVPARAATNAENRVTIVFRRIGGQWKITELFPIHQLF